MSERKPKVKMQDSKTSAKVEYRVLFHIAWRNLVYKKLRTILTVFGVIIGVGAIFFLLSFGLGLQGLVTREIVGNVSVKSIDITSQNPNSVKLDDKSIDKINNLPKVENKGLMYSFPGSIKLDGSTVNGIAYGIDSGYQDLYNFELKQGSKIDFSKQDSLLITSAALDSMGINSKQDIVGKKVSVNISLAGSGAKSENILKDFRVAGIINDDDGSAIYISQTVIKKAGVPVYNQMKIITDQTDQVAPLRQKIESYGFATSSPIDTIDQINQIFKFLNIVLVSFGAIGMVVAVLGMFNTLTISLLERTREIGLMMALGGRRIDMRKLFYFEAILLSLVGTIAGIILAMFMGFVINIFMNQMAHRRGVVGSFDLFASPPWLIGGLMLFMVIVGALVVYFPARKAERTDPVEAMRHE